MLSIEANDADAQSTCLEDREVWEGMVAKDKERWEIEKHSRCSETYQQPPKIEKHDVPTTSSPRPTRPLTAFLTFVKLKRKHVRRASPSLPPDDVTRVVAKMWQDLPSAKRNRFLRQEVRAMEVYEKELKAWQENKSPGPLEQEHEEEDEETGLRREGTNSKRRKLTRPSKAVRQSNLPNLTEEPDLDGNGCVVCEVSHSPMMSQSTSEASVTGKDPISVPPSLRNFESRPQKRIATKSACRVTAKSLRLRNQQGKQSLEQAATQPRPLSVDETQNPKSAGNAYEQSRTKARREHSVTAQDTNSRIQALNRQIERRMRKWYRYTSRYHTQIRRLHEVEKRRSPGLGPLSTEDLPDSVLGGIDLFYCQKKDALAALGVHLIEKRQVARTERIYGKFVNGMRQQTS